MHLNKNRVNYFFLLSFGAALIGAAPLFVKWSSLSPAWILFYRMFLALPMLCALNFFLFGKFFLKFNNIKSLYMCAIASIGFTVDLILWHWSMDITTVANATIIVNSAPLFVALLAFIFFKEKITSKFILCFLITYLGLIGLIYFSNSYKDGSIYGDIGAIIAAFSYAIYILVLSKLGHEEPALVIFYTTLFCCIFSIPFATINSGIQIPLNINEWMNFLLLAFLCQFGGQFLITIGLGKVASSIGALGLLMQPITATILAAYFFNELLNISQIIFVIIALFGIYLSRLKN